MTRKISAPLTSRSIFLAAPYALKYRAVIDRVVLPALFRTGVDIVRKPNSASRDIAREILAVIRDCDAVVAIVIGRNPNVFWEVGLAFALQKPLLLVTEAESDLGLLVNACRYVVCCPNNAGTQDRLQTALEELMCCNCSAPSAQ